MPRLYSKEELYDKLVEVAAKSPCSKRKVGALLVYNIVPDESILNYIYDIRSEGFNYNPEGGDCEDETGHTKSNVVHAEIACIANFDPCKCISPERFLEEISYTESFKDSKYILITSHEPCTGCRAYLKSINLNYEVWRKPVANIPTEIISKAVEDTLQERGSRYGDFSDNARIHQGILRGLLTEVGYDKLSDAHKSALDNIVQKIARIVNGDPNYKDNWHDIAGYAKLAEDRCV